mmetsp:Transcript_83943/g.241331  ORF Transcript_83943/g.241331 Transcript_83943/m.241331 type:complete len:221 (+) Transcript_83943:830-1492(+)
MNLHDVELVRLSLAGVPGHAQVLLLEAALRQYGGRDADGNGTEDDAEALQLEAVVADLILALLPQQHKDQHRQAHHCHAQPLERTVSPPEHVVAQHRRNRHVYVAHGHNLHRRRAYPVRQQDQDAGEREQKRDAHETNEGAKAEDLLRDIGPLEEEGQKQGHRQRRQVRDHDDREQVHTLDVAFLCRRCLAALQHHEGQDEEDLRARTHPSFHPINELRV